MDLEARFSFPSKSSITSDTNLYFVFGTLFTMLLDVKKPTE